MDKALRPDQFDCLPNTPVSTKEFSHCFKLFQDFLNVLPQQNLDKLTKLTYFLNQTVYVLMFNVTQHCFCAKISMYQKHQQGLFSASIEPPNQESITLGIKCLLKGEVQCLLSEGIIESSASP